MTKSSCLRLQLLILMIDSIMILLIKANCCESINNPNYKLLFVFISSTKLWNSHCDGSNLIVNSIATYFMFIDDSAKS